MKIQFSAFLFILLLICCVNKLSAQNVMDKISKEACKCIEGLEQRGKKLKNTYDVGPLCIDSIINEFKVDLHKEYGYDITESETVKVIYGKIGHSLFKGCDSFGRLVTQISKRDDEDAFKIKQADLDSSQCSFFREGVFYKLENDGKTIDSTMYVERKGDTQYDYMFDFQQNKWMMLESKVRWSSECSYELTVVDSNAPEYPTRPEDKVIINILGVKNNTVYVEFKLNTAVFRGSWLKVE